MPPQPPESSANWAALYLVLLLDVVSAAVSDASPVSSDPAVAPVSAVSVLPVSSAEPVSANAVDPATMQPAIHNPVTIFSMLYSFGDR